MDTLSLRSLVRNAAAVFSRSYGAVTRRAEQAGCSRQTVYQHARLVERRLQAPDPATTSAPAEAPAPAARVAFDEPARRRFAVTAHAMGISLRQVEDLLRLLLGDDAPDHSTIGRWVKHEAQRAAAVLEALDAAAAPRVRTLALDEVFFGGDRPWWASSRRA